MKRSNPIETKALISSGKSTTHKPFTFDMADVTGYGDSMIEGHTEILLPGSSVTIKMKYENFKTLKQDYDASNKT